MGEGNIPKTVYFITRFMHDWCAVFCYCDLVLENVALQSSSQRVPMEMRDPIERVRRTWPCCACVERAGERGTVTRCVGDILWPFAVSAVGPWFVGMMCVHMWMRLGLI